MIPRAATLRARPGPLALAASLAVHGLGVFAFWWFGIRVVPPQGQFRVYRVSIVEPPAQAYGPPELGRVVTNPAKEGETPSPAPPKPVPAPPKPTAKPKPEPKKPEAKKPEVKPAPKPDPKSGARSKPAKEGSGTEAPAKGWNPKKGTQVGGSGINVQLEGEAFPYPGYLENIIAQISRYFRWTGSPDLKAEAYFIIERDGSVSDMRVYKSSGNLNFDYTVLGAIEAAGKRKAFGPLPRGFQGDRLPISFYFQPPR
ncbi:MAG TPA: TonB C-terminal domain-containing protein [Longimicrobiales bacterium]|nr:TonB C-terminal domain-containing protein [Longimicrobiales bacterium]